MFEIFALDRFVPLRFVLVVLLFSSAWMAAVGWYVGMVHYPSFHRVSLEEWRAFHALHTSRTGMLVVLPMLVQILATVGLFLVEPGASRWMLVVSAVCLVLSVGWTGVVSGPIHGQLLEKDSALIDRLIGTNWPRALAWTVQAVVAAWALLGE